VLLKEAENAWANHDTECDNTDNKYYGYKDSSGSFVHCHATVAAPIRLVTHTNRISRRDYVTADTYCLDGDFPVMLKEAENAWANHDTECDDTDNKYYD
jgi:hypothetical protein